MKNFYSSIAIGAVFLGLSGCAGMTATERDTVIGAGAGAVIGGVVTGGHPVGVIGGAAVGGVIGHEVGERREDRRYR